MYIIMLLSIYQEWFYKFFVGAMENWGLVTYRELLLLVNNLTTDSQIFSVARVIAHEVGHMWFGNLVTMVCFLGFI